MRTWTAGVDVGGTLAKLVLADERGRVAARRAMPTAAEAGPANFLGRLASALRELGAGGRRIRSVGLAVAGLVDSQRGVLRRSPNLPGWSSAPLAADLSRRTRIPVVMANDANAAAWGIYAAELERRPRGLFAITLGTGVGGGFVFGGRIFEGASGSAGEIGHCAVAPGGEPCACGGRGCLEAYAGGKNLVRRYLLLRRRKAADAPGLDPRRLAQLARGGDALARRLWSEAGRALAVAVADLACLLNPDAVVLAGGLSASSALFMPALKGALAENPFDAPRKGLRLRVSRLQDAGALGAALLALEKRR